ncbi:odorant receptor Or1 [Tribolium castaneum]|uniref:odorant receptor Or1 n=1 Tax=Tribolium castaneum TaxID=7070 RepID=UPI0001DCBACF|nr:PREDICTED: odorant receptor Or1 [Tribolium castaneum]|eukprot:XP_015838098.1 PREDICTED: odorant receptor Or1 [Tribolium castaneum]
MDYYDWKSTIKSNLFMLRLIGLWPKGEEGYKVDFYMLYASFLLLTFVLTHIFFQTINIYFIRTNLAAVTGTIYVLLVEMLLLSKVYYLITNMTILKQLLHILDTEMFQPKNSAQILEIESNIWAWKLIYKSFTYSCFGVNMFWAMYPLFDETDRRLPFIAWYPYNTRITPFYEITYAHQIISVSFITIIHVNVDALAAALNVFNGSQFDILEDNLRNLHKLKKNGVVDVRQNLTYCVRHHKHILSFADKCNNYLNWILFLQFFISGVAIGMTMFQLTLVVSFSTEFYAFLTYGIAITMQVFMYTWFGNEVKFKSSKVSYALFECEWIDFSQKVKKDLIFFTIRLQKPVKLSAFNLFYLSLQTFMKILKTSWSYFALLHQVNTR